MNLLSEDLLLRFRSHLQNPQAQAVRLLRAVAGLPEGPRAHRWREEVGKANLRLGRSLVYYVSVLRSGDVTGESVLGTHRLPEAMLSRMYDDLATARQSVDPYYTGRAELYEVVAQFTSQYRAIPSAEDPIAAGQDTLTDLGDARMSFGVQDERHELADLETKVLGQLALTCRQRFDYGGALEWYTRAAKLAKSCGLEEAYGAFQLSRADILKRSGRDGAEALRLILPLWEGQRGAASGLHGPQLTLLLAGIYLELGDRFEARKYLELAGGELRSRGLGQGPTQSLEAAISSWIDRVTADAEASEMDALLHRIIKALELNMQARYLRAQLDRADAEQATQPYVSAIQQLWDGVAAQEAEDNRLLESLGAAVSDTPIADPFVDPEVNVPPAVVHWEAGEAAFDAGDVPTAHAQFERAAAMGMEAQDDGIVLHSLKLLMIYRAEDDLLGRFNASLRGIRLIEGVRETLRTPYQRAAYLADKEAFYDVALISSWKLGLVGQLLRVGELVKARHLVDGYAARGPSVPDTAMRELADRLSTATSGERPALLQERQRLYDRFMLAQPSLTPQWEELPDNFSAAVRDRLPPGAGALSYYNLSDQVLLIVLLTQAGETVIRQLEGSAQRFARLKDAALFPEANASVVLRSPRYVPGTDVAEASDAVAWDDLADWLLPRAVRELIAPLDHLYLSPHRQLHRLPFHALRVGERYLVETHTVHYLPNLSVLLRDPGKWSRGGVAAIAAAEYLPREGVDLPPIGGTETEARQIADGYAAAGLRAERLLGEACTRGAVLQLLDRYAAEAEQPAVLHLAIHGEDLPGDAPLDARLFLHEGSLDGFDLLRRRLPFELVVLSSCFAGSRATAGRELDYVPGDDLFGFQAAFFAAGARRVLGALWAVDDRAGTELMTDFHRHLLKTEAPATALALSMRDYLARKTGEQRDPRYWAPFFLTEMR